MDLEKISSYAILLISIFMIAFQFALALGLPYGKLAWGGKYSKLPKNLRIGSLISAIIFTIAGLISLQELLFITFIKQSTIMKFLLWFYVLLFSLSTFANIMSKSKNEKRIMTPTAIILTISFLILALHN